MPSVAIVTMVQGRDLPWAYSALSTIRRIDFPGAFGLVLVNDACEPETAARLAAASGGEVIVAGENLGVAGGRNRLVAEAMARGADYFLSLDDDLLVPPDFLSALWDAYVRLDNAGRRPGILTPATLDYHSLESVLFPADFIADVAEGRDVAAPATEELRRRLNGFDGFSSAHIYHMGIADWRRAYLFSDTYEDQAILSAYGVAPPPGTMPPHLKSHQGSPGAILDAAAPIPIDTAPGGVCFYSRALYEAVGGVDERFNPFGYEDADFALRAGKAGFAHFCAPKAIAVHDIAARLRERPLPARTAAQGKMAGMFAKRHVCAAESAPVLWTVTRGLAKELSAKDRLGRDGKDKLESIDKLAAFAAYAGNVLLSLLPDAPQAEAPSPDELRGAFADWFKRLYPDRDRLIERRNEDGIALFAPDGEVLRARVIAERSPDGVVARVAVNVAAVPASLLPPIGKAAAGGDLSLSLSCAIVFRDAGAGTLEELTLAAPGGFTLKANGSFRRRPAPAHGVAPLDIDPLEVEIEDAGALARFVRLMSEIDDKPPRDVIAALCSRCSSSGFAPLSAWLTGESRTLRFAASGALTGVPGPLAFKVSFRADERPEKNPSMAALYRAPPKKPLAKNRAAHTQPPVRRLFAEDPKVAPYPDAYNPGAALKFWRKMRYIAAARGVALTANERKLLSFKNCGAGSRAFIIGNGPSLNRIDLTKLKTETTFGVNAIYLNKEKMGFLPTHHIVEDVFVAEDRADEINAVKGPTKWFGNYLRYCLDEGDDVCWLNVACDYRNYEGFPHFSPDASRIVWVGGTVSYIGLQLAYYMGFDEVYLVGFDHSYSVPKDAAVDGNAITSASDDPNHFHPDYFGKGYRWHDPRVDRMEQAYWRARGAFDAAGRKVFNATAGGHLEVFERVAFETLF